jgi:hypothetical protein
MEKIDFQLRYENDLVSSDNATSIKDHLLMTLKYYTEEILSAKESDFVEEEISQTLQIDDSGQTTKLGILIPKSEGGQVRMNLKRQRIHEIRRISEDPTSVPHADLLVQAKPVGILLFSKCVLLIASSWRH